MANADCQRKAIETTGSVIKDVHLDPASDGLEPPEAALGVRLVGARRGQVEDAPRAGPALALGLDAPPVGPVETAAALTVRRVPAQQCAPLVELFFAGQLRVVRHQSVRARTTRIGRWRFYYSWPAFPEIAIAPLQID